MFWGTNILKLYRFYICLCYMILSSLHLSHPQHRSFRVEPVNSETSDLPIKEYRRSRCICVCHTLGDEWRWIGESSTAVRRCLSRVYAAVAGRENFVRDFSLVRSRAHGVVVACPVPEMGEGISVAVPVAPSNYSYSSTTVLWPHTANHCVHRKDQMVTRRMEVPAQV